MTALDFGCGDLEEKERYSQDRKPLQNQALATNRLSVSVFLVAFCNNPIVDALH
jgi:hypothetical protein